MSSHRPYRPSLGINEALKEISKNRGVLYDPQVVDVCLRMIADGRFSFDEGSASEVLKSYLMTENGAGEKRFFQLTERMTIGRGKTNDICLLDGKASRFHAVVSPIGNEAVIEDKDSSNGTFVNGESIKKLSLKHGDRIRIGDALISFFQESTQSRITSNLSETHSFNAP
jgi:pSer/pThr/pTyr-binding forkhead associated (FHA) protein